MIASIGERLDLVTPRMCRLGETVTQDDTGTAGVAGFGNNEIDAVRANSALLNGHIPRDHGLDGPEMLFHQKPTTSTMKCTDPTSSPHQTLIS